MILTRYLSFIPVLLFPINAVASELGRLGDWDSTTAEIIGIAILVFITLVIVLLNGWDKKSSNTREIMYDIGLSILPYFGITYFCITIYDDLIRPVILFFGGVVLFIFTLSILLFPFWLVIHIFRRFKERRDSRKE